jgi:hypothetical protein
MAWGMKDIGEQRVRFVVAVSRREKPLAADVNLPHPATLTT